MEKSIVLFEACIKNLEILKYHVFYKKAAPSIICNKYGSKVKKMFKKKESIEILKILGLFNNIKRYQKYGRRKYKSRIYKYLKKQLN